MANTEILDTKGQKSAILMRNDHSNTLKLRFEILKNDPSSIENGYFDGENWISINNNRSVSIENCGLITKWIEKNTRKRCLDRNLLFYGKYRIFTNKNQSFSMKNDNFYYEMDKIWVITDCSVCNCFKIIINFV